MEVFTFSCFEASGLFAKEIEVRANSKEDAIKMIQDETICPYPGAVFGGLMNIIKQNHGKA